MKLFPYCWKGCVSRWPPSLFGSHQNQWKVSFHPSELLVTEPFKTKIKVEIVFSCRNNLRKRSRYSRTYIFRSTGAGCVGSCENGTWAVIADHRIQWVHHYPGNICSPLEEVSASIPNLASEKSPLYLLNLVIKPDRLPLLCHEI